jgi:hypothetical protein
MNTKLKYLKTFEELVEKLTDNDYRNDDPISKLKMIELIYDTIMNNGGDTFSTSQVEDNTLDMETAEITFKYMGVPFRLIIEREEEGVQECAGGGGGGSGDVAASARDHQIHQLYQEVRQ